MKTRRLISLLAMATLLSTLPSSAGEGWVDLFNGTNLNGWEQHSGRARYFVQDGVLVGESVTNTGNSFLCPLKTYGDFELELEYRVEGALNSGVQFRSDVFPEARSLPLGGKSLPPDRLHGYQCEIDMDTARNRMWTGGIYDEMRRGWLVPGEGENSGPGRAFTEQGRRLSRPGEWNHLRIRCVGASIQTWLNGESRADFCDAMTLRGHIGLQVHAIGSDPAKAGLQARFRHIRLREIPMEPNTLGEEERKAGWKLLWDGRTGDGWRSAKSEDFPDRGWSMKNGLLTVHENGGEESVAGGDIITRQRFANFELRADFRITPGANSGIKIFAQPSLSPIDKRTGKPVAVGSAIGLEFQVLDDLRHPDAKLGREGNRTLGSLYDLIPAPATKAVMPMGEWNQARIVSRGPHVEFWLNGQKTVEFERGSEDFRQRVAASKYHTIPGFGEWTDGHILLQDHGNQVSFRNLIIREFPNLEPASQPVRTP